MTEGAVLILPPEPNAMLLDLRAQGYPFVVIDPRTALPADIAAVSAAHLTGSRLATEHLIKLGHRRIAAIAGPLNWIATDGRLLGYRAALAATGLHGFPFDGYWSDAGTLDGYLAATRILLANGGAAVHLGAKLSKARIDGAVTPEGGQG